ncbi:hypothetical protein [Nostoc sp. TCL26-01]|uniref:hypothetical protein n=1 Tax=Nostoc sp. TCL26-01 TaxID=2576904 RepID=UPI0015C0FD58|nr:hypothetical protein [Nostoc sp. TCL26-01]QLE56014.1 hypothetical protein FD725_11040 [Nostoc sp. TCL26-01]
MSNDMNPAQINCFQELSTQEQEMILGGLKYSNPIILFQIRNILASAKNQLDAVNGDTKISTLQETTYQLSEITFIITSSLEDTESLITD